MKYEVNMKKSLEKVLSGGLCLVIVGLLISPLVFYICVFNGGFSDDYGAWSAFGDYVNGVYSVLLTIFIFILTQKITKLTERNAERRAALSDIYELVIDLCSDVSMENSNKLQLYLNKARLFLLDDEYKKLMDFYDYSLSVSSSIMHRDISKEKEIKEFLIKKYKNA